MSGYKEGASVGHDDNFAGDKLEPTVRLHHLAGNEGRAGLEGLDDLTRDKLFDDVAVCCRLFHHLAGNELLVAIFSLDHLA